MKYNKFSILYRRAREQYNVIVPCGALTWKESFIDMEDNIVFWYNDSFGSTHIKKILNYSHG